MASDAYYGAGSDDFRGYVWKIPETPILLEQRQEIGVDRWVSERDENIGRGILRLCASGPSANLLASH